MKKAYIIFISLLVACLSSCVGNTSLENPEGVYVTFSLDGGVATKAGSTIPGVKELNENKITNINYYIFASGASGMSILCGEQNLNVDVSDEDGYKVTAHLNITAEDFASHLQGQTRTIVVVANAPSGVLPSGNTTLATIKAKELEMVNNGGEQPDFVMWGQGSLVGDSSASDMRATGSVELKRVISKITFKANIRKAYDIREDNEGPSNPGTGGSEETGDDDWGDDEGGSEGGNSQGTGDDDWGDDAVDFTGTGYRYTPLPENGKVSFYYAGEDTKISGTSATEFFDITDHADNSWSDITPETENTKYIYKDPAPFYSYPREWTVGGDTQPYMIIMLPWVKQRYEESEAVGAPITIPTYYKVYINNTTHFDSNTWYDISVNIGRIGSLVEDKPVEIKNLVLSIAEWRESVTAESDFNTQADIKDVRVLDIPQDTVVLYNTTSVSIPYYTSHDCIISSVKVSYKNFGASATTTVTVNATGLTNTSTSAELTLNDNKLPRTEATFELQDGNIVFNHDLVNTISTSSAFDFQDYFYEIVIKHKDANYTEKVVIQQKPALSVDSQAESKNGYSGNINYGTVIINNRRQQQGNQNWERRSNPSNVNGNMYIVTVSQLNDANLQVGDPRSMTSQTAADLTINQYVQTAHAFDGTNRKLAYYYETDTDKADVIAPKYRIASGYGYCGAGYTLSVDQAKYRCATYQEEGRPAGRWRLPTAAELKFIGTLCARGVIPTIFYSGQKYMSANGAFSYSNNNFSSTTGNAYVRCVYDEWYWENSESATVNVDTFTWGDMPREEFR